MMLKQELDTIRQAIQNEVEGYEFYKMAANQAEYVESKEAFLTLADEELKHAEYLKNLFDHIANDSKDVFDLAFVSNPPSPSIYKWGRIAKESTSKAMSIYGIGIQLERDAIAFYEQAKNNSTLEKTKKLYEHLITWEKIHLEQFTKQYQIYKEEWWSEQGYNPF